MLAILERAPVSSLLALVALLTFVVPGANALFELDFARVAEGQHWRVITGHWTHFGASHLFWDLLMFAILAFACEAKVGKWFGPAVGFMAVFCSAAVVITCSDIAVYRGLSGLDTGLFTWFAAGQLTHSLRRKDWSISTLYFVVLLGLVGKLAFEAFTGETLFVAAGDFRPLVEVHLAGAIVGLAYGVFFTAGRWVEG